MTELPILTGTGYTVSIGPGLLPQCGALAAARVAPCKAAIITDSQVAPLYLETVAASFSAAGFHPVSFVFPAGESAKHIGTLSDILEFLAASGLGRGDLAVALGGGVVGDLTGFAAGVYLRGIRYMQLPTTLLAAVDSSVGGKTAVDLSAGKNLAGLFVQPQAVVCDTAVISAMPGDIFACGAAEAVKTGILSGDMLFRLLEKGEAQTALEEVITLCVAYKGSVVEADETEQGPRRLLNLGHTPGHAIEKLSGYAVPHGKAVAMGIALMARAAQRMDLCSVSCRDRIQAALRRYGLPTRTAYSAGELAQAALADKKRQGAHITLVLPREIGDCVLQTVPVSALADIFALGWEVSP